MIDGGTSDDGFRKEKVLNKEYAEVLAREGIFWRQKSRDTWLKEGDCNTKFFNSSVKVQRESNKIFSIQNANGDGITTKEDIYSEAVHFFSGVSIDPVQVYQREDVLDVIPSIITGAQNDFLTSKVTLEEVKVALFIMGGRESSRAGWIFGFVPLENVVFSCKWYLGSCGRISDGWFCLKGFQ